MKALPILLNAILLSVINCTSSNEQAGQVTKTISINESAELIETNKNNPDFHIIDVRTQSEYETGHVRNAVNIDIYSPLFKQDIDKLEKNDTYLVYCRRGNRSRKAMTIFRELGFLYIYDMAGGITKWVAEGKPVVEGKDRS